MIGTFPLNSSHIHCTREQVLWISLNLTKVKRLIVRKMKQNAAEGNCLKCRPWSLEVPAFHLFIFHFLVVFDVFYNVKRFKHSGLDKMINYSSLGLLIKSAYTWHLVMAHASLRMTGSVQNAWTFTQACPRQNDTRIRISKKDRSVSLLHSFS